MKVTCLMILIVGATVAAAGCSCPGSCTSMGSDLYTPTDLPSPLIDVTADPPCAAQLLPRDGGSAQVMVTTESAVQGATCVLHGHLADGRVAAATITWQQAEGDICCSGFVPSGGGFTLSDAGIGGG
jgi:hypothetical protein